MEKWKAEVAAWLAALKASAQKVTLSLNSMNSSASGGHVAALNDLKACMDSLTSQCDTKVGELLATSPTAAIGAAQELNGAMDYMRMLHARMSEMFSHLNDSLTAMSSSYNALVVEQPKLIQAEIDRRIAAGDLVPKVAHETSLNAAREAAKTAGLNEGREMVLALNRRKDAVKADGLPEVPEAVLALADNEFAARHSVVKERKAALATAKLEGNTVLASHLWAEPAIWNVAFDAAKGSSVFQTSHNSQTGSGLPPTMASSQSANAGGVSPTKRGLV